MRLITKMTLLILLLTILPLTMLSYLSYQKSKRTIEQELTNHVYAINKLKEQDLRRWLYDSQRSLEELAQRPLVWEYASILQSLPPNTTAYQRIYQSLLDDHFGPSVEEGPFKRLLLLRPDDGMILASTDMSLEGKYRQGTDFFEEGKAYTYIQDITYSVSMEEIIMPIGTPLINREGELVGVLAGYLDLSPLSEIMSTQSEIFDLKETYLVNRFNYFVTESRYGEAYVLKETAYSEGIERCLQGYSSKGFYTNYAGDPVVGSYRWISDLGLCILTEIDQGEAYAPINELRRTSIAFAIGIAVLAFFISILLARSIIIPIDYLVLSAEKLRRGDLAHRIEVNSRDEIGRLASAFNRMAADLMRKEEEITAHTEELEERVSQRTRELQESEELKSLVIEAAELGVYDTRVTGLDDITKRNTWPIKLGYDKSDICSGLWNKLIHPEDKERVRAAFEDIIEKRQSAFQLEYRLRAKDGSWRWVIDAGRVIRHAPQLKDLEMIGAHFDTTQRKQMEESLRSSLHEKDVLLKEVHHRVKNNLQVVSSLLSLQAHTTRNEQTIQALIESENRIRSMALVHENLYQSPNLASIKMAVFIQEQVDFILAASYRPTLHISKNISVDEILLGIDQAIPVGLIINELISNALKYAFDGRDAGIITVEMYKRNNNITLNVSDDGSGLPDHIDLQTPASLGLQLVKGLTEQLDGSVLIERKDGTRFIVTFPHRGRAI